MSRSPSSPVDLQSERYGRRSRPQSFWIALTVVLVAVGIAWAWWVAQAQSDQPVSAQVRGYDVVSANLTKVELQVHRRDGAAATCQVYAIAKDHAVVGERSVDIPASGAEEVRVPVEVATERRAVTGELRGCELRD